MHLTIRLLVTAALATAGVMLTAPALSGQTNKVTVCHATASETNPYVLILVDDNSTTFEGHLSHVTDPQTNPDGTDRPDIIEGVNVPAGFSLADCTQAPPPTTPATAPPAPPKVVAPVFTG